MIDLSSLKAYVGRGSFFLLLLWIRATMDSALR